VVRDESGATLSVRSLDVQCEPDLASQLRTENALLR
jgi:hypothetical protein